MSYFDIWVVYDHPADYPDRWVVRAHRIETDREVRLGRALLADTLEEARQLIPIERFGLVRMDPSPDDDPVIAETWV